MIEFVNLNLTDFKYYSNPYDHWILDNFFDYNLAKDLSCNFINYKDEDLIYYNNWEKKTCNDWDKFSPITYKVFNELLSQNFIKKISKLTGTKIIYPDIGLHGGGMHMHKSGGNLAIHLDYSIHPKLNLQRKFNLIIYLEENYNPEWGGSLELWSHNYKTNKPLKKEKEIDPIFNRAVLFDTTQKSWHGFPEKINLPKNKIRKSFAIYYLTDITFDVEERYRAHYEQI